MEKAPAQKNLPLYDLVLIINMIMPTTLISAIIMKVMYKKTQQQQQHMTTGSLSHAHYHLD